MDFDLTKDQEMIRKEVRKFAQTEIAPVAAELDETQTFSADLTKKWERSVCSACSSPKHTTARPWIISPTSSPWKRSPGSTAPRPPPWPPETLSASVRFTTSEPKRRRRNIFRSSARGEGLWGFGLTEPEAGSDAGGIQDHGRAGRKRVGHQRLQDLYHQCVLRDFPGCHGSGHHRHPAQRKTGVHLFSRGNRHPGIHAKTMHNKMMWRASNTAELYFDNVRIPKENILGKQGDGFHQMLRHPGRRTPVHRRHGPRRRPGGL